MKIVVIKSMIYDGVRYEVGDEILPSLISDRKLRTLETGRFIKAIGDKDALVIKATNDAAAEPFEGTYERDGMAVTVQLTNDRLRKVFRVLQTAVIDIDEALEALVGDPELIGFVSSVENRKTVLKKIDDKFSKK